MSIAVLSNMQDGSIKILLWKQILYFLEQTVKLKENEEPVNVKMFWILFKGIYLIRLGKTIIKVSR